MIAERDFMHKDWVWINCGCCAGTQWSAGTEPIECKECAGQGSVAVHLPSGSVAHYPGGPFNGDKYRGDRLTWLKQELGIAV